MSESFCSAASLAVGEPLAGTAAAGTDRWLVLEHDGAWGPKGVEDSGLPEAVVAHLHELNHRHPRLRVQLVREQNRRAGARLRVYFAESGARRALYAHEVDTLEDLRALDLDNWLRGTSPPPGTREDMPLYLVCTHGKRDRCCALYGVPVYRALLARAEGRVLQTTHLGGHRFAATLLTLPHGLSYGRVQPEEAEALIASTDRDEIYDLSRVRGRTDYAPEVQAADVALRARIGALHVDALRLAGSERLDVARYRVRFTAEDGSEHTVELTREPLPAVPSSCGADPKPASRLVQL